MSDWYYAEGAQQRGPMPQEELSSLLQTGRIPFNVLVWTHGMGDWKPANEVPTLFGAMPPLPPQGQQQAQPQAQAYSSPIPSVAAPEAAFAGYAGFWKRFVAFVLDVIILIIPGSILLGSFMLVLVGAGMNESVAEAIGNGLGIFFGWLYWAGFESSSWQATPGKRLIGIMVVDAEGRPLSFLRATGRHFAKYLSGLILLIGYLMAGFTPQKQALHDMLAGCLVINRP